MRSHSHRKGGDPEMAAEARLSEEADRFLLEHGVLDVNEDIQPYNIENASDWFKRKAFEGSLLCVGLVGVALATGHNGARVILPA